MAPSDLRDRTKRFAIDIVKLSRKVAKDYSARIIAGQLLRCGTSVAANYRAACRARSRKEFLAKLGIVEEEADESVFWLEVLQETQIGEPEYINRLLSEANQLTAIIVTSVRTARLTSRRG